MNMLREKSQLVPSEYYSGHLLWILIFMLYVIFCSVRCPCWKNQSRKACQYWWSLSAISGNYQTAQGPFLSFHQHYLSIASHACVLFLPSSLTFLFLCIFAFRLHSIQWRWKVWHDNSNHALPPRGPDTATLSAYAHMQKHNHKLIIVIKKQAWMDQVDNMVHLLAVAREKHATVTVH